MKMQARLVLFAFLAIAGVAVARTELANIQSAYSIRATASATPGALAAQTCAEVSITVTGAAIGDECLMSLPAVPSSGLAFFCYVSAADTVKVRACNASAGSLTPPSGTYSVRIFIP